MKREVYKPSRSSYFTLGNKSPMKLHLPYALVLAGCISLLSINTVVADEPIGELITVLPVEVEKDKSFDFYVRLKPYASDFNEAVDVQLQQNPNVLYDQRSFLLKPGEVHKVTATVKKSNSGLAVIHAFAENWLPIDVSIYVGGVPLKLVAKVEQPVESYRRKPFLVGFTDDAGKPVKLEGDASLLLEGTNIRLCLDDSSDCGAKVVLPLKKEVYESKTVQVKANSWSADSGMITMTLTTPSGFYNVSSGTFSVAIVPAWWILTIMGMLGGLIYSMIQFLRTSLQSRRKRSPAVWIKKVSLAVLVGIVPGALAYPLAAWNILGIKTDTTSLKGFFILGLLFAYVGMDVVLALTAPKRAKAT
jgi:hypothetical protein